MRINFLKNLVPVMLVSGLLCSNIALALDARIKRVAFQENAVINLKGVTFTTTEVRFGRDEVIINVQGGDTSGWMVTLPQGVSDRIFVKPTVLGSDSNITVITDKRSYYFHATSNRKLQDSTTPKTYAIQFTYPQDEARARKIRAEEAALAKKPVIDPVGHPERYRFGYRFSGSPQLVPVHAFDDGTFTYFELGKNQAVPAIFAVDDRQGKESVVNTRRLGNYLVVQRIAPQFTLRHGGVVTSVFNTHEITRIQQGRRQK